MLTYTPSSTVSAPAPLQPADKPWLLIALCLLWALPGLVGHDPWKPAENQTLAVVMHMLRSGDWLLPQIAGVADLDQGPLYFWLGALLARVLGELGLPAHDAVRLSTGLWMVLGMWGIGLAAHELYGKRAGRVAVVILIGCLGLLQWGHHASPGVLMVCGMAWLAYALVVVNRRPFKSGVALAFALVVFGIGISFAEVVLALLCFLLVWLLAERKKPGLFSLLVALLIAAPLLAIWPVALLQHAPDAGLLWWSQHVLGAFGGMQEIRFLHDFGFLTGIIVWFAWPALPLAIWALWLNRAVLFSQPLWRNQLLILALLVLYVVLAGRPSELLALLLLIPLALLAAGAVDDLRRGAAQALNWFAIATFGTGTLLLWGGWLLMRYELAPLRGELQQYGGGGMPGAGWSTLCAFLLTALWILLLMRRHPWGRRSVTNWACGMTLTWAVFISLWQNWLDEGKSYRAVAEAVGQRVQAGCLDVAAISEAPRAALAYFTALPLRSDGGACAYRLTASPQEGVGGQLLWDGARPHERREHFYLYRMGAN
ncbi:ArnT family glycosyltransferase [Chitinilyticum litopenaei]|uniref:ArnT family glycosyltransferase n=1 Tax=Chitinilyticum litopenaei TaxID=1121276 RepID=UPI0003F4DB75|nr:glycosyltransferase family 39 protein [Chitinilyticum litopenaei]